MPSLAYCNKKTRNNKEEIIEKEAYFVWSKLCIIKNNKNKLLIQSIKSEVERICLRSSVKCCPIINYANVASSC